MVLTLRLLRSCRPVSGRYIPTYSGHTAPAVTDTPSGRYAGSLFSAASQNQALHTVLEDLTHLREVIRATPEFREVLKNSAVRRSKQREIFASFAPESYHKITINFIDTVVEAGRYLER